MYTWRRTVRYSRNPLATQHSFINTNTRATIQCLDTLGRKFKIFNETKAHVTNNDNAHFQLHKYDNHYMCCMVNQAVASGLALDSVSVDGDEKM